MLKYIVAMAFLALVSAERRAVVTLGFGTATGNIYFTEQKDGVLVTGQVLGLTPGKHGFHVHALGDLSNGCLSLAGHFNPHNVSHAAPEDHERHVGDLGNIVADATGNATFSFVDNVISLTGEHNIIGRGLVVHADEDDLGKGNESDSKTTGHAGARVGCGVIGTLSDTGESGQSGANLITALLPSTIIGMIILHRIF